MQTITVRPEQKYKPEYTRTMENGAKVYHLTGEREAQFSAILWPNGQVDVLNVRTMGDVPRELASLAHSDF